MSWADTMKAVCRDSVVISGRHFKILAPPVTLHTPSVTRAPYSASVGDEELSKSC